MLARWLSEHWDLEDVARDWFRHHGILPAQLLSMTPAELAAVLGERNPRDAHVHDPLADLKRINRQRAAEGRQPSIPAWLMPDVPRRRKSK